MAPEQWKAAADAAESLDPTRESGQRDDAGQGAVYYVVVGGTTLTDTHVKQVIVDSPVTPFDPKEVCLAFFNSAAGIGLRASVNTAANWRLVFVLVETPAAFSV